LEEQKEIAAVLTTADQEIETLQSQLDGLKQEKKALMQTLLTGKRRVSVDE
jgi:type I restriction enzyme S subunit